MDTALLDPSITLYRLWSTFLSAQLTGMSEFLRKSAHAARAEIHRTSFRVDLEHRAAYHKLMEGVRNGETVGEYVGVHMTKKRTRHAAAASGDANKVHIFFPHPRFKKLIAHGMDGVTQAFAALLTEFRGTNFAPTHLSIDFKSPVILDEDTIHKIIILPVPGVPLQKRVVVQARNDHTKQPRVVIEVLVTFRHDPSFAKDDLLDQLMVLWQISAILARSWIGCLYVRQVIQFTEPLRNASELTVVAVEHGRVSRAFTEVGTAVYGKHPSVPFATGIATIVA